MRIADHIRALMGLVLGAAVAAASLPAAADTYPSRPVRIVSFVPSGSAADALLRAMAVEAGRAMGGEFVVDNRPGGSGAVAATVVRSAAPDGYTLLLAGSSVMLSGMLRKDGSDPFAGLSPVTQVISTPTAIGLRSDLGARSIEDLVRLARAEPGKVSIATVGQGSYAHVMLELLSRRAGVQFMHVPYPQIGLAITDMVSGRVDGVFSLLGTMQPQAALGKVTFVGTTGDKRSTVAPNVPTFVEGGYPDLGVNAWNGLFAPAGTPSAVADRIAAEFARAARSPKVLELAKTAALEAVASTQAEFRDTVAKERSYWQQVLDETGVKAQ